MSFSGRVAAHSSRVSSRNADSPISLNNWCSGVLAHNETISEIQHAYPHSVVLPRHFEGIFRRKVDLGLIESPPESLTLKLMKSRCLLSDSENKTIGETHLLVYVPKTIGSEIYGSSMFSTKFPSSLSKFNRYPHTAIEGFKSEGRGWQLIPKLGLAITKSSKGYQLHEQESVLASFNEKNQIDYQVVPEVSLVTAIVMASLIHKEKLFEHLAVRTATTILGQPERFIVGGMERGGVTVIPGANSATIYNWGIGLSMKL